MLDETMLEDSSDTERQVQFTRHFAECERALQAFAYSLVPVRADADDIVQEALASLWKHFDDYDPNRPFLPWANRFVYRQVQMHRRKQASRARYVFSTETFDQLVADEPVSLDRDKQLGAALETCLQKLSPKNRELIVQVQFSSGATVTVEGPARLRLDDPMKCRNFFGKLAANCPPSAHGFVISFSGGKVVDLGTEFALNTEPEGKTDVHVLNGEVIVARTDEDDRVLSEKNLLGHSAVVVGEEIEEIAYDDQPFSRLKRESLIRSQPIKLQFDLGHRAGLYAGTNAPAHAVGDMFEHEDSWAQIVGDQSGTLIMADGNVCPLPILVDYGHGDGSIDWDATPVDPWGKVHSKARGIFDTALCQDHRPWDFDLGIRVSGLPAGTYRVYALCRSARRPGAAYDVSFGVNLDRQLEDPISIPPMDPDLVPQWIEGVTYEVEDVEVSGEEDWVTFITRYSRERSIKTPPHHGRSVLLGLQIVEIRASKSD